MLYEVITHLDSWYFMIRSEKKDCLIVAGQEAKEFDGLPFLSSDNKPLPITNVFLSRITSYNVCYTKLLRDFRANLTLGGKMEPYTPDASQVELALKAAKALSLDFCGVDLLFGDREEPILCEVNSNAHFKNIFDCTGVNAAIPIMEHILEKI